MFEVGNFPLVYGVGRKGAHLIAPHDPWIDPTLDWTTNNGRVTAPFLAHTTETADFVMAFEQACHSLQLRAIDHHQLLPLMPEHNRRRTRTNNPFSLHPTIELPPKTRGARPETLKIGVVPDRLLSFATATERSNFALEWDRGFMDVGDERTPLVGKSSIKRKLVGYWSAWLQELHTARWGFKSFRVLFVTPSEARLGHMLALQQSIVTGGSNLFLFSTPVRVAEHGALGPAWTTGKGETIALTPSGGST